jgi:hypothetical protein
MRRTIFEPEHESYREWFVSLSTVTSRPSWTATAKSTPLTGRRGAAPASWVRWAFSCRSDTGAAGLQTSAST